MNKWLQLDPSGHQGPQAETQVLWVLFKHNTYVKQGHNSCQEHEPNEKTKASVMDKVEIEQLSVPTDRSRLNVPDANIHLLALALDMCTEFEILSLTALKEQAVLLD